MLRRQHIMSGPLRASAFAATVLLVLTTAIAGKCQSPLSQFLFSKALFPTGSGPVSIATGDFNHDGKIDLAIVNMNGNTVSVLLGRPDGTFQKHVEYDTGTAPTAVTVGDFNRDGRLDLAVTNSADNTVSVLLGNGDGTFRSRVDYATGTQPSAVVSADFNRDGIADLAVANENCLSNEFQDCGGQTGSVSILLGIGNGAFRAQAQYATGPGPVSLAAGDLNGDGSIDLAVANSELPVPGPNSVSILLNKGNGTFLPHVDYGNGAPAAAVSLADLNGDRKLDLVFSAASAFGPGSTVMVLLGNGRGAFQAVTTFNVPAGAGALLVADLNGDGKTDVAVAGSAYISVLVGKGDGSLAPPTMYAVGEQMQSGLAAADFNGDRRLDLAVVGPQMNFASVLLGNGDGTFSPQKDYAVVQDPWQVIAGNFKDGGTMDLASADTFNGGPGTVSLLIGNKNGTFEPQIQTPAGTQSVSLVSGDFNNDGRLDLAVANNSMPGTFCILLGRGDGTFEARTGNPTGNGPVWVSSADFNKDGNADLVFANAGDVTHIGNTVSVHFGRGNGTFGPPVSYRVGSLPVAMFVGDFNGDGNPDLAVANRLSGTISILLSNADGTFRPRVDLAAGDGQYLDSITGGDFNRDGKLDLAVSADTGVVQILEGNGNGTFRPPVTITANGSSSPLVSTGDFNGDGILDLAVSNYPGSTFSILLGKGDGTFQPARTYAGSLRATSGPSQLASAGSIATGDFNGDGTTDLAVANELSTGIISVYLNEPAIALFPDSLVLTRKTLGTNRAQTILVSNPSVVPLRITNIAVSNRMFTETNDCGPVLAPGQGCTISVAVTLPATGAVSGMLTITDNAPGGRQIVMLSASSMTRSIAARPAGAAGVR